MIHRPAAQSWACDDPAFESAPVVEFEFRWPTDAAVVSQDVYLGDYRRPGCGAHECVTLAIGEDDDGDLRVRALVQTPVACAGQWIDITNSLGKADRERVAEWMEEG